MNEKLTAIFEKSPQGYIAYVEELPGANTQGSTLEEAKSNLIEAIQLVLEANRLLTEEQLQGKEIIKEPLGIISYET
jgi:predicted RNase H-like HicB family nuclease